MGDGWVEKNFSRAGGESVCTHRRWEQHSNASYPKRKFWSAKACFFRLHSLCLRKVENKTLQGICFSSPSTETPEIPYLTPRKEIPWHQVALLCFFRATTRKIRGNVYFSRKIQDLTFFSPRYPSSFSSSSYSTWRREKSFYLALIYGLSSFAFVVQVESPKAKDFPPFFIQAVRELMWHPYPQTPA